MFTQEINWLSTLLRGCRIMPYYLRTSDAKTDGCPF